MPRYFFNWSGEDEPDLGLDLPGLVEAREQATLAAMEAFRDAQREFWKHPKLQMVVTDEAGALVCELRVHGAQRQNS